jgi:hypothetical protein
MNWIVLAHDKDQWSALVDMVMNLRVSKNAGNFLSSCKTGGSKEGLSSMALSQCKVKPHRYT